MLENVNRIDWKLFGDNINIPELLRALTSHDDQTRWNAQFLLFHECPNEAYPYIIPFVIELVGSPGVPEKEVLLSRFLSFEEDQSLEDKEGLSTEEALLIARINAAVEQGLPVYINCLSDPDPKIRAAAAEAIGTTQNSMDIEPLASRLEVESDNFVCVAIVVALRQLNAQETLSLVERYLASEKLELRVQAALTVVKLAKQAPESAIQILIEAAWPREEITIPLRILVSLSLRKLGAQIFERAVDRWLEVLPTLRGNETIDPNLTLLLSETFGNEEGQISRVNSSKQLTPLQRKVVRAIAESSNLWEARDLEYQQKVSLFGLDPPRYPPRFDRDLKAIGLPTNREALLDFLEE